MRRPLPTMATSSNAASARRAMAAPFGRDGEDDMGVVQTMRERTAPSSSRRPFEQPLEIEGRR